MNSFTQLGEPTKTDEQAVYCRKCGKDEWHFITFYKYGTPTKDCTGCGRISDFEVTA